MKISHHTIAIFGIGYLFLCLITACSTKKNTSTARAYHELTTRYNVFFNAQEAYDETLQRYYENYRDDFSEQLPFYPLTTKSYAPQTINGIFSRTIEKTEKAINEHSISAKPRRDPYQRMSQEYKDWLRQNEFNPVMKKVWLLMGKAYLQDGSPEKSLSVFTQIINLFPNDTETVLEAQLWMMRAYVDLGWMIDAENSYAILKNKPLTQEQKNLLTEFYAFYLIEKEDCRAAIPYLTESIRFQKNGIQKNRLQFLLGQIYARVGENEKALESFEKLKSITVPHQFSLNALMQQAQLASEKERKKLIIQLEKSTKNSSNNNSIDQIYFAIGNAYLVSCDTLRAQQNYLLVEQKKNGSIGIKAKLALADIYFEGKNYISAASRYKEVADAQLPQYIDVGRIKQRADALEKLVPQLKAIYRQDSLKQKNDSLKSALLSTGNIFADELNDFRQATAFYNRLLNDFPRNADNAAVYRKAYFINRQAGDFNSAETYRERFIVEFPQDEYAIAMANPDFEQNLQRYPQIADSIYALAYQAFQKGFTSVVRENYEKVKQMYPFGSIMPQMMLMNALSAVESDDNAQLTEQLNELFQKFPETDAGKLASTILQGLLEGKKMSPEFLAAKNWESLEIERSDKTENNIQFNMDKNVPYLCLFLLPKKSVGKSGKNELLFDVADFNFSNFQLRTFDLSFVSVAGSEALQVQKFKSYNEALQYAEQLQSDTVFATFLPVSLQPVVVSQENLSKIYNVQTLNEYFDFYTQHFGNLIPQIVSTKRESKIETQEEIKPVETENSVSLEAEPISVEQQHAQPQRFAAPVVEKEKQKSRKQLLKERERERKKLLKQRERERKELLKQREKERKKKI